MKDIRIQTLEDTKQLANTLVHLLKRKGCLCLSGDLGAGKTTLTKYIGKALGIEEVITSPTFTILKIYEGEHPLYHVDAYRLEEISQDLGFEEYFESEGLSVIEWYEFIEEALPKERLEITIELDGEIRIAHVEAKGERYQSVLEELK
ncbi:MAG: tRNA (adenosine(37)-N6)-threonylcarbamoyltransferase complex ATPase subunit type 1 TsaE [Breznakia sp.]